VLVVVLVVEGDDGVGGGVVGGLSKNENSVKIAPTKQNQSILI
jgi:hypothetical protein